MFYEDIDKTCESIAQFSKKDSEAYRLFYENSLKTLDLITMGLFSPPASFGSFAALMDQSDEGRELLRTTMMSSLDIIERYFESDAVKVALTRYASELMICPQTKGTGMVLFLVVPMMHRYGGGMPEGGSGELSESLKRCILDLGGEVKTSAGIKSFKVVGGECKGVVLESGEEVVAKKAVVTNLNIKQVFPDMVKTADLPSGFVDKVKNLLISDYQAFQQGSGLHEAPKYKADGDINKAFLVEFAPQTLEAYMKSFANLTYGIPVDDTPLVVCTSLHDPTRAPEGKHTSYIYQYAPYNLKDGGGAKWDQISDQFADRIMGVIEGQTTNMGPDNLIGRWIKSPLDLERYNDAWPQGDFTHIGSYMWQNTGNRPLPVYNYRMPIDKLYFCGPSTHPGLGVIGGGRASVQVVMEDLGIDFEKVIA